MFSQSFVILCILGMTMAFAGEYIPKSYYVIDREGHKSDVVYIRARRSLSSFPLVRSKRGNAESSSGAHSGAGAGAGAGAPIFFGGADFVPNIPSLISNLESNIQNAAKAAGGGSGGRAGGGLAARVSSTDHQGRPGGGFEHYNNDAGPALFSRFGEGVGSGIEVSGSASGPNGGFSASSSSVDSDGKIKYSVKSGKF